MTTPQNASVALKTMPNSAAPMMLHEQVASGSYGGEEFTVIRDITGLHWQVKIGETTTAFTLNEMLQAVVTGVVDAAKSN
ncbi:hypothetical protein [Leisingera sp. M523]|uniref:hypothetical protein n=1 Tax=Leisingera sp. M523 TaxID=2867013 RepID=UPI0021A26C6E|nr:hypothetical protein [Leisingera sp. M523]UWQ29926.1 hypothetical protein K3557_05090 [Leisingera sp. M523]